jgi:hypothetical protein
MGRPIVQFLVCMHIRVCRPEDVVGSSRGHLRYRQYPVALDSEEFMTRGQLVDEFLVPGPFFVEDSISVSSSVLESSSPSSPGIFTQLFLLLLSFFQFNLTAAALPFYLSF